VLRRSMPSRRLTGIAVVLGMLILPGQAMATRYVTQTGTPVNDCQSVPTGCDLQTAIHGNGANVPSDGEEVVVEPGSYSLGASIMEGAANLNIRGVAGQPRPAITQTDPSAVLFLTSGTLSYLDFEGGSTDLVNQSGGLIDRIIMRGAGSGQFTCQCGTGTIRDSIFISTGGTAALGLSSNGGTSALTLRNVTAIATQAGTTAIALSHSPAGAVSYDAYNTIARNLAGTSDVGAFGPSATITFHHSNYGTSTVSGGGLVQDAPSDPHQSVAPMFTNSAGADFSEAVGSPTIDAGLTDALNGPLDFAGNPRAYGVSTDIGAYEFSPPPPPASPPVVTPKKKCKKHKKHKRSVSAARKCKKHRR
jgi:hypothetical protein